MLSNKDFSKLLSTPAPKGSGDGKVRFDLNQISQWDKQIKSKTRPKDSTAAKPAKKTTSESANTSENGPSYRDRAEERRKDANPDYDPESIEAVIRLDAEKTKFLGGDVDHTHLVKGLDYTLLQKIRHEVETQTKTVLAEEKMELVERKEYQTLTEMGSRLKTLMLGSEASQSAEGVRSEHLFARLAFDFDLRPDPDSLSELPTVVARSRQDASTPEDLLIYLPDMSLLSRLGDVLSVKGGRQRKKRREKERETEEGGKTEKEKEKVEMQRKLVVDTVGDIFNDVGRYVPAGVEEEEKKETEEEEREEGEEKEGKGEDGGEEEEIKTVKERGRYFEREREGDGEVSLMVLFDNL
mmetsp:Transcript_30458/g.30972  ORF Transcript_30458/g.30972 Transcript_30458/m.30972 type:complete len:354 (-) Transcript_30458:101-1162(-)